MDEKIYKDSFENAVSRGEMTAFHESAQRSTDCIAAIDAAIEAGRHDQYFYKLSDSLNVVAKEFSMERIEWVVAGAISAHDYDGRYSQQNKTWAQDINVPEPVGRTFNFATHATVLDGFADTVRAARLHDLAQVVGASCDTTGAGAVAVAVIWGGEGLGVGLSLDGSLDVKIAGRSLGF